MLRVLVALACASAFVAGCRCGVFDPAGTRFTCFSSDECGEGYQCRDNGAGPECVEAGGGGPGGSGGSAGGGGSGGSGGSGGGSGGSGGGSGGSGGSGGGSGGSGGAPGNCAAADAPIVLDAGCAKALPSPGACGGSLPGTWCYASTCVDPASLPGLGSCPSAYYKAIVGTVSGTVVFDGGPSQGSLVRESTVTLDLTADFPSNCFGGASCASIEAAIVSSSGGKVAPTCGTSGDGGCLCSYRLAQTSSERGSYATGLGPGLLAVFLTDGGALGYEYCVQGNTLRYREVPPAADAGSVVTLVR